MHPDSGLDHDFLIDVEIPPQVYFPSEKSAFYGVTQYYDPTPERSTLTANTATNGCVLNKDHGNSVFSYDTETAEEKVARLGTLVTQVDEKPSYEDTDGMLERRAKRRMQRCKIFFCAFLYGSKSVSP